MKNRKIYILRIIYIVCNHGYFPPDRFSIIELNAQYSKQEQYQTKVEVLMQIFHSQLYRQWFNGGMFL